MALNWEVFVSTICQDDEHTCIILLENSLRLFTKVYLPNPSIDIFFLNVSFVLLISDMRELNDIQSMMLLRDPVPNKGLTVFAHAFDLADHSLHLVFGC